MIEDTQDIGLGAQTFTYTYGAGGALASVGYPTGRTVSYDLNGANRVSGAKDVTSGTYYLNGAQYKANGLMASATFGRVSAGQFTQSWGYNSRQQMVSANASKGSTLLGLQWLHTVADDGSFNETGSDNNGNVKKERITFPYGSVDRSYGYDGVNRLHTFSLNGATNTYGFDAFGNVWQSGPAAGGIASLRATDASAYVQPDSSVNNRLSGVGHDAAGNLTQLSASVGTNATYDGENRLVKVDINGSTIAVYDYDADGRRVRRTDGAGGTTWYVYDADGELMAEYGGSNSQSGTQYPVTDHLGSTRLIVDANGNCVSRTDYAPFGSLVPPPAGQVCSGQQPSSGMLFTGQSRDGDTAAGTSTGLDYFGARFYWASLGRFTSADEPLVDQIAADSQSWNLYAYVRNNPLTQIDPTGRCSQGDSKGGLFDDDDHEKLLFEGSCASQIIGEDKPFQTNVTDQPTWAQYFGLDSDYNRGMQFLQEQDFKNGTLGNTTMYMGAFPAGRTGTVVYRGFGKLGEVLYVGITSNLKNRARQHVTGHQGT